MGEAREGGWMYSRCQQLGGSQAKAVEWPECLPAFLEQQQEPAGAAGRRSSRRGAAARLQAEQRGFQRQRGAPLVLEDV